MRWTNIGLNNRNLQRRGGRESRRRRRMIYEMRQFKNMLLQQMTLSVTPKKLNPHSEKHKKDKSYLTFEYNGKTYTLDENVDNFLTLGPLIGDEFDRKRAADPDDFEYNHETALYVIPGCRWRDQGKMEDNEFLPYIVIPGTILKEVLRKKHPVCYTPETDNTPKYLMESTEVMKINVHGPKRHYKWDEDKRTLGNMFPKSFQEQPSNERLLNLFEEKPPPPPILLITRRS